MFTKLIAKIKGMFIQRKWKNASRNQGLPKPVLLMVRQGKVRIISRGKDYCLMEKK